MNWTQAYNPLGYLGLSALVAALPLVVVLGLLAFFNVRAHTAAAAELVTAMPIATLVCGMREGWTTSALKVDK